jgi:hypothetical protein
MSATNLLFTYLPFIYLFYLGGSDTPQKGELVEAGHYILVDVYYCLVPVNEHECVASCSCLFVYLFVCLLEYECDVMLIGSPRPMRPED